MAAVFNCGLLQMLARYTVCAALLCAACDVDPATTTPETYVDFLKLSNQLTCEASLRCCGTVCTPMTDAEFYQPSTRVLAYLDAGLLAYDRQAADNCLAIMQQRYTSCDAVVVDLPPNTVCTKILLPKAPIGGRCETGISTCAGPTTCTQASCSVRHKDSESCIPGLIGICQSDSDTCCQSCTGVCTTGLPAGQACLIGNPSACQIGTYCNSTTMKCTAYSDAGQACSPTQQCLPNSGLGCLPSTSKCGPAQANGATCTDGTQCISTYCLLPNLPQVNGGTCQPQTAPVKVREQLCATR